MLRSIENVESGKVQFKSVKLGVELGYVALTASQWSERG